MIWNFPGWRVLIWAGDARCAYAIPRRKVCQLLARRVTEGKGKPKCDGVGCFDEVLVWCL